MTLRIFCNRFALQTALSLVVAMLLVGGCAKRTDLDGNVLDDPDARSVTHVVADGETLDQVADIYYGDPARAAGIAKSNGLAEPNRLVAGSSLQLRFDSSEWELARRRAAAMAPYNRGVGFLQNDYVKQAEEEFRNALELAPAFVGARYNLALVLIKAGKYDEARQLLASLLSERPAAEDIAFALGHVLFLQARFAEAVDVFSELLDAPESTKSTGREGRER